MNYLEKVTQFVNPVLDAVDEHFQHVEPLKQACKAIGIRTAHIIIPFFIMAVIALGTGIFSDLFVTIFGMIYPAYMTFHALKNNNFDQCKQWLTYWIVFGFFTAGSTILRYAFWFLSYRSYNVFRVLFYVFLFHPQTKGAALIYNKYLRSKISQATTQFEQKTKSA